MNTDRINHLLKKNGDENRDYVLYWMQQSMRSNYNHALEYAIYLANKEKLPLVVIFVLNDNYLGANLRHYTFMLEGLKEVALSLKKRRITFVLKYGDIVESLNDFLKNASSLVMDYGYLKVQKAWRKDIYNLIKKNYDLDLYIVESDLVVPVRLAYPRLAYGAYVIRPTILKNMDKYLDFDKCYILNNYFDSLFKSDFDLSDIDDITKILKIDFSVKPYLKFKGGYKNAIKFLEDFSKKTITNYENRNDPSLHIQSYLSIYLHFGQISVLEVINYLNLLLEKQLITKNIYESYIEQLVVRRELSFNFVTYRNGYDLFSDMTEPWAYETINEHQSDVRDYLYTLEQFENSKTHDIYFNASMREMRITGFMANYMRMYWAKKIMEWSNSMEEAYNIIVHLNNKYFLDGRDANSYANIAWCFGKNDRAWSKRNVFGKIRYMNENGLKRFDMNSYVEYTNTLLE